MAENTQRDIVRLIVPLAVLIVGGALAWYSLSGPKAPAIKTPAQTAAQQQPPASTPATPTPTEGVASTQPTPASDAPGANAPPTSTTAPTPTPPAQPASSFRARTFPARTYLSIGSSVPKDKAGGGAGHELEIAFSPIGAGVDSVKLANHFTTIKKDQNETLLAFEKIPGNDRIGLAAFAADAVEIDGQRISLWATTAAEQVFWEQRSPGVFEAIIENSVGQEVLKITRGYELREGRYEFVIRQSVENVDAVKHAVRFVQFGPKEMELGKVSYGGDVRRARFGYMLPAKIDPAQMVHSGDSKTTLIPHATLLGSPTSTDPVTGAGRWESKVVWPTEDTMARGQTAVWAGLTSRYFMSAVQAPEGSPSRVLTAGEKIERVAVAAAAQGNQTQPGISALRLTSASMELAPGQKGDVSVGAYVGPLSKPFIKDQPGALWAGLSEAVIFTFGGPCGFCTFQTVAEFLRWFLGLLHDYLFHDWALSIMFLVVCVRGLLHPVTRWSQTNMTRFGKHMSRLGPKMKAIQEKYASDPVKLREETARLYQQEHVSYASGALGCVPMFLQMPVWLGLTSMISFMFELRHEHAFYGAIQNATNHAWGFLGDLAEPDKFIGFGRSFSIPLISGVMGPIEGLNILPLVMGVVFYIQQKYMTPPQATQLSPEMETQQKMMKVMTVVMFPLFMYNAPSGLALYFLTNSTLGIVESKWIRSHAEKLIEKEDAARAAKIAAGQPTSRWAKKGKDGEQPTTIIGRLQKMAEEYQKMQELAKKAQEKKKR